MHAEEFPDFRDYLVIFFFRVHVSPSFKRDFHVIIGFDIHVDKRIISVLCLPSIPPVEHMLFVSNPLARFLEPQRNTFLQCPSCQTILGHLQDSVAGVFLVARIRVIQNDVRKVRDVPRTLTSSFRKSAAFVFRGCATKKMITSYCLAMSASSRTNSDC